MPFDSLTADFALVFLLAAAGGYLCGSIPFGLLLTRTAGLGDIRSIGSGNIGATNVLRTGRKGLAALTLLLDAGKGAVPVLLAQPLGPTAAAVAGVAALAGHVWPLWLRFRGGKGVATALGVLVALAWPVGLLAAATWLLVALVLRTSSLAALVAATLTPAYALVLAPMEVAVATVMIAAVVWFRHRDNLRRLLAGTEPRIGGSGSKNG